MSSNDDEVLTIRRILERIESCRETEITDVMDSFAFDAWEQQHQPQHDTSCPSTPVSTTIASYHDNSRAMFLSPLRLPVLDDAYEVYQCSMEKPLPHKVYVSPRIDTPDFVIFPSFDITCQKWRLPNDRWKAITEQAGIHGQDGTILKLCKRVRTPQALKMGVLASVASRVLELHIPMDRKQQASLRTWMDVVTEKFHNLKHLHLVDSDDNDSSSDVDETITIPPVDSDDGSIGVERSLRSLDRHRSVNNKRLYVLYRLPKLVSINGKSVTVSERLQSRPNQQLERCGSTQKMKTSLLEPPATRRIQKFEPIHDQPGSRKRHTERSERYQSGSWTKSIELSLLDEDENDDDTSAGIADQCVEVSLSGCLIDRNKRRSVQNSVQERFRIIPFEGSGNGAERAMATIAELDRLEYCTAVSSHVGACEWTAACGMMALPDFRREAQTRPQSPNKNPSDIEKIKRGTNSSTKTRLQQIFKQSNSTSRRIGQTSNYQSKNGSKSVSQLKPSKPWILKSNGQLLSPASHAADDSSIEHSYSPGSRFIDQVKNRASISIPSLTHLEIRETPDGIFDSSTTSSPITTEIASKKQFASPCAYLRRLDVSNAADSKTMSTTPTRPSLLSLSAGRRKTSSSHSLTSPFPMQFRIRAKSSPKLSETNPDSSTPSRKTKRSLSIETDFCTEEQRNDHQPSSPPMQVLPRVVADEASISTNSIGNLNGMKASLSSNSSHRSLGLAWKNSSSNHSESPHSGEMGSSSKSCKPPPCPSSTRRTIVTKSSSSVSSKRSDRVHPYDERKSSVVSPLHLNARNSSILDEDDDNDSTSDESKSESEAPTVEAAT